MYARAIDEAEARLQQLRQEEWGEIGVAAVALGVAVAATQLHPPLALPLLVGGLAVGAFGVRALWRRWDLVDRLAGERDAYVISEVLAYASREATIERRRNLAGLIRLRVSRPDPASEARVDALAEELEELARELEAGELELDPACAVACARLLSYPTGSPLLDPALPPEEVRSRLRQIRSGFRPRRLPA